MANLIHFMSELLNDPELQEGFRRDPEAVMEEYGLDEDEKDAIRSRDPERVGTEVTEELEPARVYDLFWGPPPDETTSR